MKTRPVLPLVLSKMCIRDSPHFLHRRKFEEAECGWYYSQRLKSVQIKYKNPKKDYRLLVSFEQFDLIGM